MVVRRARNDRVGSSSSLPCGRYAWVSKDVDKIASMYESSKRIIELRKRVLLSVIGMRPTHVSPIWRGGQERVHMELTLFMDSGLIYMYETFFACLWLRLPFTNF